MINSKYALINRVLKCTVAIPGYVYGVPVQRLYDSGSDYLECHPDMILPSSVYDDIGITTSEDLIAVSPLSGVYTDSYEKCIEKMIPESS